MTRKTYRLLDDLVADSGRMMKRGFDLTSQYPCNCLLVTIAADFLNDIKSGSIGINITRNQDTASAFVPTINYVRETAEEIRTPRVPLSLQLIWRRETAEIRTPRVPLSSLVIPAQPELISASIALHEITGQNSYSVREQLVTNLCRCPDSRPKLPNHKPKYPCAGF